MSALDFLETILEDPYTDTDINWVQYISDHVGYLRSTTSLVYPSAEVMAQNMYDVKRYIRNVQGGDQEIWWIVLLMNDLRSDMEFTYDNVANGLYVPTTAQIRSLYSTFISTSANRITQPIT